jgi:nondiscriminating glutamyl-tRNA synthetase
LFNFLFARRHGGTLVLRIDDTDLARSEERHEAAIIDDLRWMGLDWDEGPDVGGPFRPYRQREREDRHHLAAESLLAAGAAYHCFCPQERLEALRAGDLAAGRTPRYDRRCSGLAHAEVRRRLAGGEPAAVRFRVPDHDVVIDDLLRGRVTVPRAALGDFIIVRSDGGTAYNFASVVDDRDMDVSHVIRGDDHLTNTARQLLLFAALGAAPPSYAHHSLILGPDGGKLSKRHGATSVGEYRELGYLPEAVVNYLALLSWSHGEDELLDLDRLVQEFELERLSSSAAVFDQAKLDWLDHERILRLDPREHARRFAEWLPGATPPQAADALAAAFQPSLVRYGDAKELAAAVLEPPALPADLRAAVARATPQLGMFAELRAAGADWLDPAAARDLLTVYRAWGKERGRAARDLLLPLRIAMTGREHGPELQFVLAALTRDEALRRVRAALAGNQAGEPTTTQGDQP